MGTPGRNVLAINAGSSSIKFAVFSGEQRVLFGNLERVGVPGTALHVTDCLRHETLDRKLTNSEFNHVSEFLVDWILEQTRELHLVAVGHRVVYGMQRDNPEVITPTLVGELRRLSPFDPEHLPCELELIDLLITRAPDLPQIACFDTSFHSSMPTVARLVALPRKYGQVGVRRYGFHGLSYEYVLHELASLKGATPRGGRAILAHLGNGASMVAVQNGKSIETTMGFSPVSGLVMGTRSGDIDPGILPYLERVTGLDSARFYEIVTHSSGLLGISETSADMRDLLRIEDSDNRAREAVELFCYQAKKWVGALAAVLCGLDTLVFSGGIGENAPVIRARICDGLQFLGIGIDEHANALNEAVISDSDSPVVVRVVRTDEELMIARAAWQIAKVRRQDEEREHHAE